MSGVKLPGRCPACMAGKGPDSASRQNNGQPSPGCESPAPDLSTEIIRAWDLATDVENIRRAIERTAREYEIMEIQIPWIPVEAGDWIAALTKARA